MINLLCQGVLANSDRINSIVRHVNKIDTRNTIIAGLVIIDIYFMTKAIKGHEKRITDIETKLKEIESKGE